jgi:hypothetical protein
VHDARPQPSSIGRRPAPPRRALADAISMGDFSVIDDGHRLEAPVWVRADSARPLCRPKAVGSGVVEQQEGTEVLAALLVEKHRSRRKATADPVYAGMAQHID